MGQFLYKAKEGPGKVVSGLIEAANMDHAINKVLQLGFTPVDISPVEEQKQSALQKKRERKQIFAFKKASLADIVLFTRQMADLVEASVPILRSLQLVARQTHNIFLQRIIEDLHNFVKDGGSFSGALAIHSRVFGTFYVSMVKTGEVSGKLEKVLSRLADYMEKKQEMQRKVVSSLAYPAVIVVVGVLTMVVLLTFVIPRLTVMFEDFDQKLPLPTVILVNTSSFFVSYGWMILVVLVLGGVYLKRWMETPKGRYWVDEHLLRTPVLGKFLQVVEISQMARTLATLLESGVVITTALGSVWATVNNVVLQDEIKRASAQVANGTSLQGALSQSKYFPEMAVNMIAVGEETGNLDKSLYKVAEAYDKQSDQTVKILVNMLGPAVLVAIVAVVGFMIIAMLLPIFKMNTLI